SGPPAVSSPSKPTPKSLSASAKTLLAIISCTPWSSKRPSGPNPAPSPLTAWTPIRPPTAAWAMSPLPPMATRTLLQFLIKSLSKASLSTTTSLPILSRTSSNAMSRGPRVPSSRVLHAFSANIAPSSSSKCTAPKITLSSLVNSPHSATLAATWTKTISSLFLPSHDLPAHRPSRPPGRAHRRRRGILPLPRIRPLCPQFRIGNPSRLLGKVRLVPRPSPPAQSLLLLEQPVGPRPVHRPCVVLSRFFLPRSTCPPRPQIRRCPHRH